MSDAVRYLNDIVVPDLDLAGLLDEVGAFYLRFVSFTKTQAVASSLWTASTHVIEAFWTTGYMAVTSPEKRSGKTRWHDVAELLVAKPWRAILPSEAVMYRKLAEAPGTTLLLDEVDGIFGKNAPQHEGIRAALNAGYRRGTMVPRCVGEGKNQRVQDFDVFGAKALAGIGALPDTVSDRCIHIRLQRRAKSQKVEGFYYWDEAPAGERLRKSLADALSPHLETLRAARPERLYELDDRLSDSWEPLFAIADLAGGAWPKAARIAALELAGTRPDDESLGVQLLAHMREALGKDSFIGTENLLKELVQRDDAMWPVWWGKQVEENSFNGPAARLGRILKPFEIKSKKIWFDDGTPKGATVRGFQADELAPIFDAYLPPNDALPAPSQKKSEGRKEPSAARVSAFSQKIESEPKSASDQEPSDLPTSKPVEREGDESAGALLRPVPLLDTFPGSEIVNDPIEFAEHYERLELHRQNRWVREWNERVKNEEDRNPR
ncbi:MAG: DUF3631 domain-containing protein [Actinomycetota bacterium]|nr:DUF3631 domain-containing protein [Actinomycetota bacterium]